MYYTAHDYQTKFEIDGVRLEFVGFRAVNSFHPDICARAISRILSRIQAAPDAWALSQPCWEDAWGMRRWVRSFRIPVGFRELRIRYHGDSGGGVFGAQITIQADGEELPYVDSDEERSPSPFGMAYD